MSTRSMNILIQGRPDTGKTTYLVQLYLRLRHAGQRRRGLRLARGSDTAALRDELSDIAQGRRPQHTSSEIFRNITLHLTDDAGRELSIPWPDYGGEQLDQIITHRALSRAWIERARDADAWLLFIRPKILKTYPDRLAALVTKDAPTSRDAPPDVGWDDNATTVKCVQLMLDAARVPVQDRVRSPRLAVVLSCWDELDEPCARPSDELARRLPMVAEYLAATWAPSAYSVWGLSSLGKPLARDESDDAYLDEGPEAHGSVILPDGAKDSNLTRPLAWLIAR